MEQFFAEHYMAIGLGIAIFITLFGLVWTVLERRLIVSRKHVTGWSGFNSVIIGAIFCAGAAYFPNENILRAIIVLAAIIALYALICLVVPKKEYPPEERYTKEQ